MQNSVPTFLSWVLAMGISAIPSLLDGQEFDLLTANCLLGYENDDYPQLCAEVWPQLKEEVTQAKRLWQSRNARKLIELQNACELAYCERTTAI